MRSQLERDVFALIPGEELCGPYADETGDYSLARENDGSYTLRLSQYECGYPPPTRIYWQGQQTYATASEAFGALSAISGELDKKN